MVCAMANSSFYIQPNTHTLIALISVVLSSIVVGVTIISSSPTRQNIARITKKKKIFEGKWMVTLFRGARAFLPILNYPPYTLPPNKFEFDCDEICRHPIKWTLLYLFL